MSCVNITSPINSSKALSAASTLSPQERQRLAMQAIAGVSTISELASTADTSRKFIYAQKQKAEEALDKAFSPSTSPDDKVLFYLPVTKEWIHRCILELMLVCHCSMRGVCEALKDLLDFEVSLGTVHNVVQKAVEAAREQNAKEDLSKIKVGAHDEIFQGRAPVLVGCDAHSTYCYLLSLTEKRDADTWGLALLEAREKGLNPEHTIGDGGQGLRAGQALVWPDTSCHADVFHALKDFGDASIYLENRAYGALAIKEETEKKMEKEKKQTQGNKLSRKLGYVRAECDRAITLSDDIRTLLEWLQNDVLNLAGSDLSTREELFDFIVAELRARESQARHRIRPVRRKLQNQKKELLQFAGLIDQKLGEIAQSFEVDKLIVRQVLLLENPKLAPSQRSSLEASAREVLRHKFYPVEQAVRKAISEIVRASSVVENLNSRLRNYFFLRKQLGPDYLDLLRFFLNHRRFIRSRHPDRVGKSPREIMTGQSHPHWLDMLLSA